jgi:DNA-binding NarL/FixJ family response regulator
MRILIADDHALFRDSLRSLLEAHDLDVVAEAKDGKEAVEMAWDTKPDVVLMDLTMPEMDGRSCRTSKSSSLPPPTTTPIYSTPSRPAPRAISSRIWSPVSSSLCWRVWSGVSRL